jgi:hypothetical protein
MSNGFTLAAEIDKRKRKEGAHGAIEFIGRSVELGEKQIGCFAGVAQIAQRTCELNGCAAASQVTQAGCESGAVQGNRTIRMARGILSRSSLKQSNGTFKRKLGDQQLNLRHESLRLVAINRAPQSVEPTFPGCVSVAHCSCALTIKLTGAPPLTQAK